MPDNTEVDLTGTTGVSGKYKDVSIIIASVRALALRRPKRYLIANKRSLLNGNRILVTLYEVYTLTDSTVWAHGL